MLCPALPCTALQAANSGAPLLSSPPCSPLLFAPQVQPSFGPCDCDTLRPRMLRAVYSLGQEDVRALLQEQGNAALTMHHCVVDLRRVKMVSVVAPMDTRKKSTYF